MIWEYWLIYYFDENDLKENLEKMQGEKQVFFRDTLWISVLIFPNVQKLQEYLAGIVFLFCVDHMLFGNLLDDFLLFMNFQKWLGSSFNFCFCFWSTETCIMAMRLSFYVSFYCATKTSKLCETWGNEIPFEFLKKVGVYQVWYLDGRNKMFQKCVNFTIRSFKCQNY